VAEHRGAVMLRRILMAAALSLLAACGNAEPDYWQGYIEGDYRLVAPEVSGRIEALKVGEGEHVEAGAPLFTIEGEHAGLQVAQARARVQQAASMLADLEKGARAPEVTAVRASLRESQAALKQAEQDAARLAPMAEKQFVSAQSVEQAESRVSQLKARVDRLHAELAIVQLSGRKDRLAAARAEQQAADAALAEAERLQHETAVKAPAAGIIERVIRRAGELASASTPVLRLLPDDALKVVFFVPETEANQLTLDSKLSIACDGCKGRGAQVNRLASRAEYTPPVLFNRDNRDKLVFRLEASLSDTSGLFPGLPVEVQKRP